MTVASADAQPLPETASPARRRVWQGVVPLLLVLVLGIGGKVASLDALRAVQALGRIEAQVSRVEIAALHMALSFRRDDLPGPRAQAAGTLGRHVIALQPDDVLGRFPQDPVIGTTLRQLQTQADPARLSRLAEQASISEADALALLAASTADAVHAAIAVDTGALWQRVWALGGGAVAGLLLTAIGGSTLAALALRRVQGFMQRIEEHARRLRQADALRERAVAEAEVAAVARTKALVAETLARLEDARRLADAARAEAETGRDAIATALVESRRAGSAGKAMLEALAAAIETPLAQFRALSPALGVGHTITAADRANLDAIERASVRLARVADGMLDLVRLDAGRASLVHQPFRPELLLARVHETVGPAARRRGITFSIAVAPESVESCIGDPARVEALLVALANHAIDRVDHGSVTLAQTVGTGLGFLLSAGGLGPDDLDADSSADPGLGFVRAMAQHMGGTLASVTDHDGRTALRLTLPTGRTGEA